MSNTPLPECKMAPVQGWPQGIPWSLHLEAYAAYSKKWAPQPALIDLEGRNCRGGFSTGELDEFIPGWREKVSEITALREQLDHAAAVTAAKDAEIAGLRADFAALQHAIVGDTGASAILEAGRLRERIKELEDAMTKLGIRSRPRSTRRQDMTSVRSKPDMCTWQQDGDWDSDTWGTSCGHYFCLEDGTPTDNKMKFCCYCSKPLVSSPIEEPTE